MAIQSLVTALAIVWAAPASLVGLAAGAVGLCTGGKLQRRGRVLEFWGGRVAWLLQRLPHPAMAMTLGHTVLGVTEAALDVCREHELVHVRQYERWGPLMIPAYLLCSVWLWAAGKDPYRDNPFEREAFEQCEQSPN